MTPSNRTHDLLQKVETPFGSMYVHLQMDADRRPVGFSFSTPGKCDNTQLDEVIRRLGLAADDLIKEAAGLDRANEL